MREAEEAEIDDLREQAKLDPTVAAVLATFPNARIGDLQSAESLANQVAVEALEEVSEEWDPVRGRVKRRSSAYSQQIHVILPIARAQRLF